MHTSIFLSHRCAAVLALLLSTFLFAAPAQADPAGRIGRISLLSGTVNLYNPESGDSFVAPLNQPLTSGDVLSTEPGSRAEIQIGSTTVRLDAGSRLELDRIDDEQVRLYLAEGRSIVKISSADAANDFSMETPNGRFTARSTGIYRFDTDANSTTGTAYYGNLYFETSDSALDIGPGQNAQFWQDGQTRFRMLTPPNDEFTQWSAARDQRPAKNTYSRYVSPEMTGAEDLDAYGNWSETPEFGAIWYPRAVAADWAPYRNGQWAWVAPWGWTWVGREPWGFAPFHYGRWVQHRGAWGWVPGTRIARPVYAPAMVAWIGSPGVSLSLSIGSRPTVGWFPLAPREVYVPAYRSSVNYVRNINVTHVTRITNAIVSNPQAAMQHAHYAHRDRPQAVTVVPAEVVTHRRPVNAEVISQRDHRALRDQPLRASAPVSAPQATPQSEQRNRQERPNSGLPRRDHEQQMPAVVSPAAAPVPVPQRNERPTPEVVRPRPQGRPEVIEARRQEVPAPSATTQTMPPVETRNRQDRPDRNFVRPDREPPPPAVAAPEQQAPVQQAAIIQDGERPVPDVARPASQPRNEHGERRFQERPQNMEPAQHAARQAPPARIETPPPAAQQAPVPQVAIMQRTERPMPEVARPATQTRNEPIERRVQERPRNFEPVQQAVRQAPPSRIETPPAAAVAAAREVSRPAEPPRPEVRPQRQQAERQHPAPQDDEELRRRRKNDGEKR